LLNEVRAQLRFFPLGASGGLASLFGCRLFVQCASPLQLGLSLCSRAFGLGARGGLLRLLGSGLIFQRALASKFCGKRFLARLNSSP